MLRAELSDPSGADLGFSFNPVDWGKSAYDWTSDAASAVGGKIKEGAGYVWDGTKWIANKACDLVTRPDVQGAAAAAQMVPDPTAQTTGRAVIVGSQVCNMARGAPPPPPPPGAPSSKAAMAFTAVAAFPTGAQAAAKRYPVGTIAAFDPKRGSFRIAIPPGSTLGALEAASFVEVATAAAVPAAARVVTLKEFKAATGEKKFFDVKNPLLWAAVGGTALVLGGGYWYWRRRR